MKRLFGYVRVSTVKQGEHGVSLQEQRDAISRYAERHGLNLAAWFEERQTAAKRGRPIFNQMLKLLKQGKANGVIIHKIDRSARNLKDWADLGQLIDEGIDVHFANESLDLHSRGGRLSADIQAVVAADYIRNLREETRKGFYGRLKQGLYPLPAPLGYLNQGKGKVKEPDPEKAPMVRKAFELYGSGRYNLDGLVEELWQLGLRNRRGGKLTRNGLSTILNNPFYVGLIRIRRTRQTFPGSHEPLISKSLSDRVQRILTGKTNTRTQRHQLVFSRLLTCVGCGYSLIGEVQKGHVYYRCHTAACPTTGIGEESVETTVRDTLAPLKFDPEEEAYLADKVAHLRERREDEKTDHLNALTLRIKALNDRLGRLTDAYVDHLIDREIFEERKTAFLMERKGLEERLDQLRNGPSVPDRLAKFLELAGSAYSSYKVALHEERRDLLKIVTSNRAVNGKSLELTLKIPFNEVAERFQNANGDPYRDIPRTWDILLPKLIESLSANPTLSADRQEAPFLTTG